MARPDSQKAYWAFAALGPLAIYAAIIGLLGIPLFQRQYVGQLSRGNSNKATG